MGPPNHYLYRIWRWKPNLLTSSYDLFKAPLILEVDCAYKKSQKFYD